MSGVVTRALRTQTYRRMKVSASSATSRQPLSMVRAWLRPESSWISVTLTLCCCCLNEAFAIAKGTV